MSDEQQTTDQVQEWYTNVEVAERYRTTVRTVQYWRLHELGPLGVKVGARVLYPRSEIERYDKELKDQLRTAASA